MPTLQELIASGAENVAEGKNLTPQRALEQYNAGVQNFGQEWVDDFIKRNPNDYNRIDEAYRSEWGGAGLGLSREQSGQMQSQGYSFTNTPGMTWQAPSGKLGTSYDTSETGKPFNAAAGANIPQGWWNEGGGGSGGSGGSGGGGGGGGGSQQSFGSSGAYSSVPGSSAAYESGVAKQNALLGDFGNTPDWEHPFTEQFSAPTEEEARQDPGWEFRLAEGEKARQRAAAAKGTLLTGGTAKALERYAQDYSSAEYDKVYGRDLGEYKDRYTIFRNNEADRFNSQRQNRQDNWGIYSDQWKQGFEERQQDYNMWAGQQELSLREWQTGQEMERLKLTVASQLGSQATPNNISNIIQKIGEIKANNIVITAAVYSDLVRSYGQIAADIIVQQSGQTRPSTTITGPGGQPSTPTVPPGATPPGSNPTPPPGGTAGGGIAHGPDANPGVTWDYDYHYGTGGQ